MPQENSKFQLFSPPPKLTNPTPLKEGVKNRRLGDDLLADFVDIVLGGVGVNDPLDPEDVSTATTMGAIGSMGSLSALGKWGKALFGRGRQAAPAIKPPAVTPPLDSRISGLPPVRIVKPSESNEDKIYRIMLERVAQKNAGKPVTRVATPEPKLKEPPKRPRDPRASGMLPGEAPELRDPERVLPAYRSKSGIATDVLTEMSKGRRHNLPLNELAMEAETPNGIKPLTHPTSNPVEHVAQAKAMDDMLAFPSDTAKLDQRLREVLFGNSQVAERYSRSKPTRVNEITQDLADYFAGPEFDPFQKGSAKYKEQKQRAAMSHGDYFKPDEALKRERSNHLNSDVDKLFRAPSRDNRRSVFGEMMDTTPDFRKLYDEASSGELVRNPGESVQDFLDRRNAHIARVPNNPERLIKPTDVDEDLMRDMVDEAHKGQQPIGGLANDQDMAWATRAMQTEPKMGKGPTKRVTDNGVEIETFDNVDDFDTLYVVIDPEGKAVGGAGDGAMLKEYYPESEGFRVIENPRFGDDANMDIDDLLNQGKRNGAFNAWLRKKMNMKLDHFYKLPAEAQENMWDQFYDDTRLD